MTELQQVHVVLDTPTLFGHRDVKYRNVVETEVKGDGATARLVLHLGCDPTRIVETVMIPLARIISTSTTPMPGPRPERFTGHLPSHVRRETYSNNNGIVGVRLTDTKTGRVGSGATEAEARADLENPPPNDGPV